MIVLVAYFGIALTVSLILTPVCRRIARRAGFVAPPKDDRWHRTPTALFGGIAIASTTIGLGIAVGPDIRLWPLLGAGAVMALVGVFDDVLTVKPSTKLVMQISLASVLVFLDYRLGWTDSLVLDAMLTLLWVVGITNSFNLLDNMDGLCAGIALIAGTFLLGTLYTHTGVSPISMYLAVLLGATAGFLVYNIHPATIFMGDTGSLFLGFNLAALTLIATSVGTRSGTSGVLSVVAGPVLLLLIPIFDTTLVTVMRIIAGRRPSQGGRDHSSHRLVAIGLPESTAVATLWFLAIVGGGLAVLIRPGGENWFGIVAMTFVLAMIIFAVYLAKIRVYEDAPAGNARKITPLVVDFMYKRRVAEVLLDLCLIPLAYYSAYRLRFEGGAFFANYPYFLNSLPVVLTAQMLSLFVMGGYRGTWRHFGIMDAVVFAKSVALGATVSILAMVFAYNFASYSRAVFVIYSALVLLLLCGTRASFRLVGEFINRRQAGGLRCLVYGTSGSSLATLREAFGQQPFKLLGFVDDDPSQMNARVSGYPVLGNFSRLLSMIDSGEVDRVVMNTNLIDLDKIQRLHAKCHACGVELMILHVNLKPFTLAS
jgi:UDP-GlcNAc:undecaprenyl-phosphate/decaprenyl-phosphate GlcNAc-1-phosphate transferase